MCDSLVALPPATADGQTWFAKNSDRHEDEAQPFLRFPGSAHAAGATVRCTHLEIPQAGETFAVMGHSPWWVWGFEQGTNQHGVAISNHSVFSREPLEEKPGLIGMDLVRLGLERGDSARGALDRMVALLESHGQGGAGFGPGQAGYHNSFLLADAREAWILETSGRHWGARRTRLGSLSNQLCLGTDWELGSRDLESFAREQGWSPDGTRLDLAAAYRNRDVPERISEGRLRRSRALLESGRGRIDRAALEGILRDHGESGAVRQPGSTPEEERFFTLCMHSEPVGTTTASMIAPLGKETAELQPVWISFATPCTGLFLPVYLAGELPDVLARGGPKPEDSSAWWSFSELRAAAAEDFPRHTPRLRAAWAELEADIEAERVEVERAASKAPAPETVTRILSEFMERSAGRAIERARTLRAQIS